MKKINSKRFAHVKFEKSEITEHATLIIDGEEIRLSSQSGKWFTNIPALNKEVYLQENSSNKSRLEFSDSLVFHPEQLAFDAKYGVKIHSLENNNIYYSLRKNSDKPRKLLVTFPGVSSYDNIHYRLSALTSLQSKIKNCAILALQDKYGVYGNYMYKTDDAHLIKPILISLISGLCAKFELTDNDIIFYGNSKGGSIALDYVDFYKESTFFIDIPQLNLAEYKAKSKLMSASLSSENIKHYYFIDKLKSLKNKKINYSFAENDFDSSTGIPLKELQGINSLMLKDSEHSGAAMELIKKQYPKIIQIVNNSKPIIRCNIDARIAVKNNHLYITRVLSAFTNENDMKKVFAEVEFIGNKNSFFVSLNKKFDVKTVLYWKYGFDVFAHLKPETYSLKIHVYYNEKEFIYPLNQKVSLNEREVLIIN